MSFLAPLVLIAGLAVAVPLALHLLHRARQRPTVFPALRYLQRTEKEHARRIRLRQLAVLALRISVLLVLALAGARLLVRGSGAAHPPTAVVVVLDNSLSSGRVVGEERLLDALKRTALAGLSLATPEDRIWVLRAGSPWETAVPMDPEGARARIAATEPTQARGDLAAAVRRARRIVADAGTDAGEIHLVSDLQATAVDSGDPVQASGADDDAVPVLVAPPPINGDPPVNHYLQEVSLGGGLPPLAERRTPVAVTLAGSGTEAVTVRLFVDDRVRGAATLTPGSSTVLPLAPPADGWITGWVEADPDALRDDDRRWFSARVSPPPVVAGPGAAHPFLTAALETLAEGGRIVTGAAGGARVVLAAAGAGLAERRPATVVLPPVDPARLPALNRRLADAGIPWRYGPSPARSGSLTLEAPEIPVPLDGVRIHRRFELAPAEAGAVGRVLARSGDGAPWAVLHAPRADRRVLLLAHPLEDAWSTLPVDAAMIPFVEWLVSGFGASAQGPSHSVGLPLPLPSRAESVALPDGTRVLVDGTSELRVVSVPGIYTVLEGDSVLARIAVNPPLAESILATLDAESLQARIGPGVRRVVDESDWPRKTFTRRLGREAWRPLVALALLLLMVESWLAASGGATHGVTPPPARTDTRRAPAG